MNNVDSFSAIDVTSLFVFSIVEIDFRSDRLSHRLRTSQYLRHFSQCKLLRFFFFNNDEKSKPDSTERIFDVFLFVLWRFFLVPNTKKKKNVKPNFHRFFGLIDFYLHWASFKCRTCRTRWRDNRTFFLIKTRKRSSTLVELFTNRDDGSFRFLKVNSSEHWIYFSERKKSSHRRSSNFFRPDFSSRWVLLSKRNKSLYVHRHETLTNILWKLVSMIRFDWMISQVSLNFNLLILNVVWFVFLVLPSELIMSDVIFHRVR